MTALCYLSGNYLVERQDSAQLEESQDSTRPGN